MLTCIECGKDLGPEVAWDNEDEVKYDNEDNGPYCVDCYAGLPEDCQYTD